MGADGGLEVRLLGPVEVRRDGRPVHLGGPRQRALLALLAIRPGHVRTVDDLIEELWSGEPPDGAATSLRSYISRLRRSLGDERSIAGRDGGYVLNLRPEAIDSIRFESLVRLGEQAHADRRPTIAQARLREAEAIWFGAPFGEAIAIPALGLEAVRLEELHLRATELRLDAALELGESASLIDELERLVHASPYHERLWRHLMLALYRAGRQADALAAYRRARAQLREELGIEPSSELQELEASILRHDVPVSSAADERHNLAVPVSSFVGREDELRDLSDALRRFRLVTITGVGGVGKTRVAIEAARAQVGGKRDGVWFVDLAPLADPELVPGQVATALGISERPGAPAMDRLVEHLQQMELLLVLDNCEHVRAACAELVATTLANAGGVRILATSREPLAVPGEAEFPLQPLRVTDASADEAAGLRAEAVRLFVARAREARPTFTVDGANVGAVLTICRDLDGLPLGIELAAAKVRTLSPSEIAARLDDRMRFLVSWRRLAPARHRTLREAMDWSFELLQPEERALLAALSVFTGTFTLEAVASICVEGDNDRALMLLERLVESSLVVAQPDMDESRYRLLETVRQYAAAQLAQADGTARLRDLHASFYSELAARWHGQVQALGSQVLTRLVPDESNLRAALVHLANEQRPMDELRMASAMWRLWWLRGSITEGRARLREALDGATEPTTERAEALRGASTLALRQLDLAAAIALAEEGLEVASRHGELPRARAMVALANALGSAGNRERARELYLAGAERFRVDGYPWELANCLLNMVDLALNEGNFEDAERLAAESLDLTRKIDDKVGVLINVGNLGFAALERGDGDRAGARFEEGLALSLAVDFGEFTAIMVVGLAAAAAVRGLDRPAAMLLGCAERLLDNAGASLDSIEGRWRDRTELALRERMGRPAFDAARADGRGLAAADATRLAQTWIGDPRVAASG
jgi:predicted ATPase/DNA-binding SARP family transcriptional activator